MGKTTFSFSPFLLFNLAFVVINQVCWGSPPHAHTHTPYLNLWYQYITDKQYSAEAACLPPNMWLTAQNVPWWAGFPGSAHPPPPCLAGNARPFCCKPGASSALVERWASLPAQGLLCISLLHSGKRRGPSQPRCKCFAWERSSSWEHNPKLEFVLAQFGQPGLLFVSRRLLKQRFFDISLSCALACLHGCPRSTLAETFLEAFHLSVHLGISVATAENRMLGRTWLGLTCSEESCFLQLCSPHYFLLCLPGSNCEMGFGINLVIGLFCHLRRQFSEGLFFFFPSESSPGRFPGQLF